MHLSSQSSVLLVKVWWPPIETTRNFPHLTPFVEVHRATKTCFLLKGRWLTFVFRILQSKAWGLVFQTWDLMDCSIFSTFRKCQRCSNNLKRQMHILRRWDLCWQGKTTQKCGFVKESAFIFSKIKDDEIRYIHSDTDGSGKKGTQCRM